MFIIQPTFIAQKRKNNFDNGRMMEKCHVISIFPLYLQKVNLQLDNIGFAQEN